MAEYSLLATNTNNVAAQEVVGGDFVPTDYSEVDISEIQAGSALQTMLNRAQQFKTGQAQNDNIPNGDDNGGGDNTPSFLILMKFDAIPLAEQSLLYRDVAFVDVDNFLGI